MSSVVNLLVIIAGGVILADLVAHIGGTNALFSGIGSIWQTSVNGMLGNVTTMTPNGPAAAPAAPAGSGGTGG